MFLSANKVNTTRKSAQLLLKSRAAWSLAASSYPGQCHTQTWVRNYILSSLTVLCLLFFFSPLDLFLYFWSPPGSWLWAKNGLLYDPLYRTCRTLSHCSLCKSSHVTMGMHHCLLFWHWHHCDFCPSELHHWATGQENTHKRRLLHHGFTASCNHSDPLPTGEETLLVVLFPLSILFYSYLCS